ncbi:MAG: hypothetical protein ACRDAI_08625 [Candidatus Rhabdochlamydia sp.]
MGFNSETITVIISILIPTLGGVTWIIHRMDARFEKMEARVDARFEKMEKQMDSRFEKVDARFEKVDAQFERVDNRMNSIEGRIGNMEHKLTAIDMRTSFIERLLEMVRLPQIPKKEIKEITDP